jgi:hypothetical protein
LATNIPPSTGRNYSILIVGTKIDKLKNQTGLDSIKANLWQELSRWTYNTTEGVASFFNIKMVQFCAVSNQDGRGLFIYWKLLNYD